MEAVAEGQEFAEVQSSGESNSLANRMAKRKDQLERDTTEWFPIPGYEGLLEVEMRALGFTKIREVQKRNEKVRDEGLQELYNLADQIAQATEGFRAIDNGQVEALPTESWRTLARRLPDCPETPTTRQAILFLIGEKRIHFLVQDWSQWARTVRPDIEEEVVQDFGKTG
jgi:hypothetical protein